MSRPLKVAHLTPAFFAADSVVGGGERYVYNVAKALAAAQETLQTAVKQCVFTVAPRERLFAEGRIPVRVLRNESIFDGPMQHFAWPLWQELAGFDLIHVHQSLTIFGAFCTVVAKSLGKTLVLTDLGGGESKLMLDGKGLELADGVVSISRYAHSLISGAFSGPHEILIGPVDTDFFVPAAKAGNPRTAICVSRLLPHKGIDQVISTLPPGMSSGSSGKSITSRITRCCGTSHEGRTSHLFTMLMIRIWSNSINPPRYSYRPRRPRIVTAIRPAGRNSWV